MNDYNDIVGKNFDRLYVLEYLGYIIKDGTKSKRHYYKCQCTCDKKTILTVERYKLLSGHSTSCGCKLTESLIKRNKKDNPSKYYIRKINDNYIDDFGICHIKMSNTDNEMLCDKENVKELLNYHWNEHRGYARSSIGKKKLYAHRIVMNLDDYEINKQIDHINGNTLDNRKQNLRVVTSQQNGMNSAIRKDNTSGVTGVGWDKSRNIWYARIQYNNRQIYLGYYTNFEDAVKARIKAENKYFGEYGYNNSRKVGV